MKSQLIGKDPDAEKDLDAGKDRRLEEKDMTEEEMVGWHHGLNGREFEQASGDSEGQGSPPAAVHEVSPRVRHDERLNSNNLHSLVFKATGRARATCGNNL